MTILDGQEFERVEGLYTEKEAQKIAENWRSKGYYARAVIRQSKGKEYRAVFTRKR